MKLTPKQAWECLTEKFKQTYAYIAKDFDGKILHLRYAQLNDIVGWEPTYTCVSHLNIEIESDWKDSLHYKGMCFIRGHYTCDNINCVGKHILSDCLEHSVCDPFLYDEENDLSYCNEKCYEEYHLHYKGESGFIFHNNSIEDRIKKLEERLEMWESWNRSFYERNLHLEEEFQKLWDYVESKL